MKKKLLGFSLCVALSAILTGCSGEDIKEAVDKVTKDEKKEDQKWINESAEKIGKEITGGEFVIDGVVYKFPMDLQYWLDNGWHVSNSYDNADEFKLEPGVISTEFELYNEDNNYVRVSVLNTSEEDAKVDDCMVYSLYMSLTEVDAVFPQGITKRNKPAEVLKAYGEPESKGDESGLLEAIYSYEGEDDWKCLVELNVVDNDYTIDPFTSVDYTVISFDDIWDSLVKSEGIEKACEIFLDATMKTCYFGEYAEYLEYGIDSESGAIGLYESEVQYFADCLMYYAGIDVDYISDETVSEFDQIAVDVLKKVKWEITDIEVDPFEEGTVTLKIYPTNYWTIIEEDINGVIDQFNVKYEGVDFESMSDEEYVVVEEEYAAMIIEAMKNKVKDAGILDAVEKEYELDIEASIVSDDSWVEIDDIIMDLYEE